MTQTRRELEIEAYSQRLYALEAQQKAEDVGYALEMLLTNRLQLFYTSSTADNTKHEFLFGIAKNAPVDDIPGVLKTGDKKEDRRIFLELQERIQRDFNPDFCLIDARTGITDMGGVATTLLPDTVVWLALDSTEHLEGLRAMMQGVQQTTSKQGTTVNLVPISVPPQKTHLAPVGNGHPQVALQLFGQLVFASQHLPQRLGNNHASLPSARIIPSMVATIFPQRS